jgi:hypothetical protein
MPAPAPGPPLPSYEIYETVLDHGVFEHRRSSSTTSRGDPTPIDGDQRRRRAGAAPL